MIDLLQQALHFLLHVDTYLTLFVAHYGTLTYILLFAIIFAETGFVVTPFLPGDSLLFAAGSIAAQANSELNIQLLFALLLIASIAGNKVNYLVGRHLGPKVFCVKQSSLFNPKYLEETHRFYKKHGGKTIIIARFMPIIRTFAPFVAGIGNMSLSQFSIYNMVSALLWIGSLLYAGYYFGSIPIIQQNFSLVVYGIIGLSIMPPLFTFVYRKAHAKIQ